MLARQRRQFVIDDNNRSVIRFLLYYFNGCPLAEEVFPGRGTNSQNIMLQGGVGVGKTMLMQVFSEYLMRIRSPRFFITYLLRRWSITIHFIITLTDLLLMKRKTRASNVRL